MTDQELKDYIKQTVAEAVSVEIKKYLQELTANKVQEQTVQTVNTNTDWRELKKNRNRIKDSIDTFYKNIPSMSKEEVDCAVEKYIKSMQNAYDRPDLLEYAVSDLKETANRIYEDCHWQIPSHLIPSVEPTAYSIKDNIVLYCQIASENLTRDLNSEYANLVPKEIDWYLNDLNTRFAPVLSTVKEYPIEVARDSIKKVWNMIVSNFQV